MLKNFIFDVDRTLIDSFKPELETLKEALYIVNKIEYSDDVMNKLTILTTDEFFKTLGIKKNSETMQKINYYWGSLLKKRKLQFFDGIQEILMDLKNKGYFLGIATSRTKEELEELDELLKYINIFDIIVTSDMVKSPKPNPESINIIIENFELEREETIYIGDSQSDSIAAKNAQVAFGLAVWENKNTICEYDYLFETPKDIMKLYEKNKRL